MEFDRERWQHQPESAWLVKLVDDRVRYGTISDIDERHVLLDDGRSTLLRIPLERTDWIRPLLQVELPEWHVVAGFQAEDTTFDTWWLYASTCLMITYSDPMGFEEIIHVIEHDGTDTIPAPGTEDKARARQAFHDLLVGRRPVPVPPLAHLQ